MVFGYGVLLRRGFMFRWCNIFCDLPVSCFPHPLFATLFRFKVVSFRMGLLWKQDLQGRNLVFAVTAASCQAFLLLGYDQGTFTTREPR